jgi:hypothetical protein
LTICEEISLISFIVGQTASGRIIWRGTKMIKADPKLCWEAKIKRKDFKDAGYS